MTCIEMTYDKMMIGITKKKKFVEIKGNKIWCRILLFSILQFAFFFFFPFSSTPHPFHLAPLHHPDREVWNLTKLIRSSPSTISLLTLQPESIEIPRSKMSPTPILHSTIPSQTATPTLICDRSNKLYDWCHLKNPTLLEPETATFFRKSSFVEPPLVEKLRPYPRKSDTDVMSNIQEITLTTKSSLSPCTISHKLPALVFSIGGFTGNFFHDFNDGFVPLYVTTNTLFSNQDVILVIADYSEWWYGKYEAILPQFSNHPIINFDNQTVTHCFPSVAVGLITHGPMNINPALIPHQKTFLDFRASLEEGYRKCLVWPPPKVKGRPRLVLVSRTGPIGRVILNQDNVIKAAQEEGFDVVVFEPSAYTYLCDVYRLINGSHAIMGVHGAALTHSLFLQPGAAFLQVVPLGSDWLAKTYFRNLAKGMKLEYTEYKIKAEESTLSKQYGKDHVFVREAESIASRNWSLLHSVYLRSQDVKLDLVSFRGYLKNAYVKAKKLMEQQGFHVRRRSRLKRFIRPPVFSYTYGVGDN